MPSNQKDRLQFKLSPTLFVSSNGKSLCFYLRPGPVKRELMPLIKAAGGQMCRVQQPGAILLRDPEEKTSMSKTTAHWYVSTKYIQDCIEKNERLNIEDYRLNPKSSNSPKGKRNSKPGSPGILGGRTSYSAEEDEAILRYVCKHKSDIGGNSLWQSMARQQVTCHSWQSMKYRFKAKLAHRLQEYTEADAEKENKKQNAEHSEGGNTSGGNASPQTIPVEMEDADNSSEADLTQISTLSNPRDNQVDSPRAECNASDLMETSKSEIKETPEQEQLAQPTDHLSSKEDEQAEVATEAKSSLNSVDSPKTRQLIDLENVSYTKRLRSSGTPPEGLLSSSHKHRSRAKTCSSLKSDSREEAQAPPKKIRKKMDANVAVLTEEESEQSDTPNKTQTEVVCPPPPPAAEKELGILEMATKEFEDDSESESAGQHETPGPSTSTEANISTSSIPDPSTLSPGNQHRPAPKPAEDLQQSTANPNTVTVAGTDTDPDVPVATTQSSPPIEGVTSKAHLFIFESESQEVEEDSQPFFVEPSGAAAGKAEIPSLTQDQLEEDVQFLKAFMEETGQDLVSVTKAILRASGDLIAAKELLLNLSQSSGPFWTRSEDQSLCSEDPAVREELLNKYGEVGVAKRLMFLELE